MLDFVFNVNAADIMNIIHFMIIYFSIYVLCSLFFFFTNFKNVIRVYIHLLEFVVDKDKNKVKIKIADALGRNSFYIVYFVFGYLIFEPMINLYIFAYYLTLKKK